MTDCIFHTADEGERWDKTAYKYSKNTYSIKPLIEANPHLSGKTVLNDGDIIKIPIDKTITEQDKSKLPIWKQRNSVERS